jgi:hypothetical protein
MFIVMKIYTQFMVDIKISENKNIGVLPDGNEKL